MLCSGPAAWIRPGSFLVHNSFLVCFSFFGLHIIKHQGKWLTIIQSLSEERFSKEFWLLQRNNITDCCKIINDVPLNKLLWESSLGNMIFPWSSKATGKSSDEGWTTPLYSSLPWRSYHIHESFDWCAVGWCSLFSTANTK